uniref:ERAP1-like C-terminal domain-containing protein n=1 Tax=Panagrolaimus superbus TaxID=310955 RepID=A0A914YWL0_9BILA
MDSYTYIFFGNETKPMLRPCIDYAKNIFSQVVKNCKTSLLSNPSCNKIDVGYRSTIYAIAVKYGNKEIFEFVWQKYLSETEKVEKESLLQGLASTQDYGLAKRVIEYHIENATHVSQFCVFYYNANTLKQLRPYLMNNLAYLVKKTKGTKFLATCFHAIYRFPQKENLVKEVKDFEITNKEIIKGAGGYVAGAIAGRRKGNAQDYKVQKNYAQTLNSFLYQYVSTLPSKD